IDSGINKMMRVFRYVNIHPIHPKLFTMSHHSQKKIYESLDILAPVGEEELNVARFYLHNIYEHLFNGKIGAPVHEQLQNGAKVLEFCCDGGIWSTEVAAEHPNSEFYAIDFVISDYFAVNSDDEDNNVKFIECDISKKLPFLDNEFDYVFSKDKCLFMERNTFQQVLLEIFRVLKPGGWLEIVYSLEPDVAYAPAYTRLYDA
ncbi:20188_t:CDS:2, partial [Cetraspora pellucida]